MEGFFILLACILMYLFGFFIGEATAYNKFKAPNKSLNVRDNKDKVEKCKYYPCDGDFDCPYPMEPGEPDCY